MNKNNEYLEIKNKLGPCGLSCDKCFAFKEGKIKHHSEQLMKYLGNFDIYAERFVTLLGEPKFRNYAVFKGLLDYFVHVECQGCRKETCKLFKDCNVRECHKAKGVDFCFQCDDFPCQHTGFDKHLHKRSVEINTRMKKNGVVAYYNEIKDKPRY